MSIRTEETSTQLEIYTTIGDLEDYWSSSRKEWGLLGPVDVPRDEQVRFVIKHDQDDWTLEREADEGWFVALPDPLDDDDVPGIADMHHRGMIAAATTIDAAGRKPFDSDGGLLVAASPGPQDWQAELDDLDREGFTEIEREEYLDGWATVMGFWQDLVDDGTDVPDATRQVAGGLLDRAAEADEPASLLSAARTLLGDSRVEMSERMGLPTQGHQASTLRSWECGQYIPQWEGRKKIRTMAETLLSE